MAIRFDHVQYAKTARGILAGTEVSISLPAATYTDYEVWHSHVNPGFNGTLEWAQGDISAASGVSGTATANTLTGKMQIRCRGEASWVDLVSMPSLALTASLQGWSAVFIFDGVAGANTSPAEVRLIISTTASTTVLISGGITCTTRTVGESV